MTDWMCRKKPETQFCSRKAALNSLELDIKIINLLMLSEGVRACAKLLLWGIGCRYRKNTQTFSFFLLLRCVFILEEKLVKTALM